MQNLDIINKINGNNFIQKLIGNLKPGNFVAFNGPIFSGKSVILDQTKNELEKNGHIVFKINLEDFDQKSDFLEQLVARIFITLKETIGIKLIERILKSRNLKTVIKKKVKTNTRAVAFRYFFKQSYKNFDINKNHINLVETLGEVNKLIDEMNLKITILFDNLNNCELESLFKLFKLLEDLKKHFDNVGYIIGIDLKWMDKNLNKNEVLLLNRIFTTIYNLEEEIEYFKHDNRQITAFISKQNIRDLLLINLINNDLILVEKWLARNYNFNDTDKHKEKYFNELCYLFWFLSYLKHTDNELINDIIRDFNIQSSLIKTNKLLEKIGNLDFIKINLKKHSNTYESVSYQEILNFVESPFKSNIPILLIFQATQNIVNVINEFSFLFIFKTRLLNVESILENRDSISMLIENNDLSEEIFNFLRYLNPRSILELEKSRTKEIYNLNLRKIVAKFLSIV